MSGGFWELTAAERREVYGGLSPALKRLAVERAKENGIEVDFLDSAPAGLPDKGNVRDALDAAAASGDAPVPAGVPRETSASSALDSEIYEQLTSDARARALRAGTDAIAKTDNVAKRPRMARDPETGEMVMTGDMVEDLPRTLLNRGKQVYRGLSEGVGGLSGAARWAAQLGPFGEENLFDLMSEGADNYGKEASGATPGALAAEEASLRAWMEGIEPMNEFERKAAEGRRPTGREILYHRDQSGRLVGERNNVENASLRIMGEMGLPVVGLPSRAGKFIGGLGKGGGAGLLTRTAAGAYSRAVPSLAIYLGANYADSVGADPELGAAFGGLTAAGASLLGDLFFGKAKKVTRDGKAQIESYLSGTPEVDKRDLESIQRVVREGGDIAELLTDAPVGGAVRGGVGRRIGNFAAKESPETARALAERNEEFRTATLGRLREMVEQGQASAADVVDHLPRAEADAARAIAAPLRGHSVASARWAREHLPADPPAKEIDFDMKKAAGEVWDDFQSWFTMKAGVPEPALGADDIARRERASESAADLQAQIQTQGAQVKAAQEAEETAKAVMDNAQKIDPAGETAAFQAAADKYDAAHNAAEKAKNEHARLATKAEAAEFDAGNGLWTPARLIDLRRAAAAAQRAAVDSHSQTAPAKAKFYGEFIGKIDAALEENAPEYAKQMGVFRGKWDEHLLIHNPVRDLRNPRKARDKKAWRDDILTTLRTPARLKKWLAAAGGGDMNAGAEAAWGGARQMMTDDEFIRVARDLHRSDFRDPALGRIYSLARKDAVAAMMRRGGEAPLTEFKSAEDMRALGRIYEGVKDTPEGEFIKHAVLRERILTPGENGKNVANAVVKLLDNRGAAGMFTAPEREALATLGRVWDSLRQIDKGIAQGIAKSVDPDRVGGVMERIAAKLWQMNILVSAETAVTHSGFRLFRVGMKERGAEKLLQSLMVNVADGDVATMNALKNMQNGKDKKGLALARVIGKITASAMIAARNVAQSATPGARVGAQFGEETLGGYSEEDVDEILRMGNRGRPAAAGEARTQ